MNGKIGTEEINLNAQKNGKKTDKIGKEYMTGEKKRRENRKRGNKSKWM
jgi:hypothetical protein